MLIIHGDDTVSSYRRLSEIINTLKNSHDDFIIKDASDLNVTDLRQATQPTNLFGHKQNLIIKNLLGGNKGKQKVAITDVLSQENSAEIIVFETKKISDSVLKVFPKAKIESFNINVVIFKFLDMIRPGNNKNLIAGWNRLLVLNHEPEYIYTMIVRQFRLLIQAKSGPSYLKLSPYPKRLILAQANYFELLHLLELHHSLYEIDKKVKTGSSTLPLDQLMIHFLLQI